MNVPHYALSQLALPLAHTNYHTTYPHILCASAIDPQNLRSGKYRAWRGGSWFLNSWYARVSYRGGGGPGYRDGVIGVRCAGD
jgi:formylglycine-generating enzyme required for sulfatase activity